MKNPVSLENLEFGRVIGLIHEVMITGRKVGATADFFAKLAHEKNAFRKVLDALYNGETFRVSAEECRPKPPIFSTYILQQNIECKYLGTLPQIEFPTKDFTVTFVGGVHRLIPFAQVYQYLRQRGYRPLSLSEGMMLLEHKGYIDARDTSRCLPLWFPTLDTPVPGPDGRGTYYPNIGYDTSSSGSSPRHFGIIAAHALNYGGLIPAVPLDSE